MSPLVRQIVVMAAIAVIGTKTARAAIEAQRNANNAKRGTEKHCRCGTSFIDTGGPSADGIACPNCGIVHFYELEAK